MSASVQLWELVLPKTPKGSADAWVSVKSGRLKVEMMSGKAQKVSAEAIGALRWALLGAGTSRAYPWRRVKLGRRGVLVNPLSAQREAPAKH